MFNGYVVKGLDGALYMIMYYLDEWLIYECKLIGKIL